MRQLGGQRRGRASYPEGIQREELNYRVRHKPGLVVTHSAGGKPTPLRENIETCSVLGARSTTEHTAPFTITVIRAASPRCCPEVKFRRELWSPSRNRSNLPWAVFRLGSEMEKIFLFFMMGLPLLLHPTPLQRDSAVCANAPELNKQLLLSWGNSARINASPYQLFPPHYHLEIYLLPNCPSSARLHLESLIAALS